MGTVAEHHRQDLRRLLRRVPNDLSRVSGREWQDLAAAMYRRRNQALALVPPIRRTLRAVPSPTGPVAAVATEPTDNVTPEPDVAPDMASDITPAITPVLTPPVNPINPSAGGADHPA